MEGVLDLELASTFGGAEDTTWDVILEGRGRDDGDEGNEKVT